MPFRLLLSVGSISVLHAATDIWELPPLRYSETEATDPITELAKLLESQPQPHADASPLSRLRLVLRHLEIPEASQILVFSKTSKQNELIHPGNPRALYFNENAYVGYVPGGDIEVISQDPILGPVFYLIRSSAHDASPQILRQHSSCLSCHGTARTESVPGVLVRSVFPDPVGQPRFNLGSHLTTHASPIPERWGGYYVTGRSSLPHLGNQTFTESGTPQSPTPQFDRLPPAVDSRHYLQTTSDIVALMVLEHQCQVLNQVQAASIGFRRYLWLRQSLNPEAKATDPVSREFIDHAATRIADLMFFAGEADLGPDGIEGDPAFQSAFSARFPKSRQGRSLADFQLNQRLFKHPCSYMIYSRAFQSMPDEIRSAVLKKMRLVLDSAPGPGNHPQLSSSTRAKILRILEDTLPGWPKP